MTASGSFGRFIARGMDGQRLNESQQDHIWFLGFKV